MSFILYFLGSFFMISFATASPVFTVTTVG